MTFLVSHEAIDIDAIRSEIDDVRCGAAVVFEGRIRDHNEGRSVERLEYEIYEPLSIKEGNVIMAEAAERWDFIAARCVHRDGLLELGDVAVVVAVVSGHRDEAFQAARYIIDEIKHRLPIWKKEHYVEGDSHWVNCQRCAKAG